MTAPAPAPAPQRSRAALLRGPGQSSPLRVRGFQLLTAGQVTSTVGDFCYAVALPWFVLSAHGGPVLLGAVLACYGIPRTVLVPVGGIVADRIGHRALMLLADVARALLLVGLTVLAARHLTSLAALGPVAALLGAGEGLFLPASFSIMPSLLPPEQLQAGNAINSAAIQIGTVAGPALGGILVATAGPVPGFAVDAATFGVSALSLWLMRPAANEARAASPAGGPLSPGTGADGPVQAPDGVTGAGADGTQELDAAAAAELPSVWRLWAGSRFLQVLGVISVLANLTFAGTFEVALPALAHARFGADGYGTLMACLGAGSVAGTLLATRPLGRARPMVVASLAFTASGLTVIALPYLGGLPGGSAAALLFGAGIGFGDVIVITLVQQWAPPALLGRVMSLVMLASIGTFPVSVAIAGVAVRALGPVPFFPVAGAVLALVPVIALTSRETRNFRPGPAPPETAR